MRRVSPRLVVVLGYACTAILFTWPLVLHLSTAFSGDPGGDTGVYVWNQWVFQHEAVVEHRNPLSTQQILSLTQRVDLSQHNYTAFLNILALPLIPWLGVVATFNVVFLIATVLTAVATYALARRVTAATRLEAWLAGFSFAWSPILVARSTAHFSLVAAAPLAAFLLCLINADRSKRPRDAALAGLCIAWAAFCDVYYALYCLLIACAYLASRLLRVHFQHEAPPAPIRWTLDLMLISLVGLIIGLLLGRSSRLEVWGISVSVRGLYTPVLLLTIVGLARIFVEVRPHVQLPAPRFALAPLTTMVIAMLSCAGPLSPVLYGLGEGIVDGRYVSAPTFWRSSPRGVDLLRFFEFNPNHWIQRWIDDRQINAPVDLGEYTAALGLTSLLVISVAVWRAGYRPRIGWIGLTALFAALGLGPFVFIGGMNTYIPGPWALLRYAPIIGSARMPSRFTVVAALGVAVLLAGALAALGRRYPARRRAIAVAVGCALAFELAPVPRTLYSARIPSIYEIIAADPRPVRILELPFGVRDGLSSHGNFSARYQYYQTLHHKRLIGGYLSRISRKRIGEVRSQPTLDALMIMSEGGTLDSDHERRVHERAATFISRANVGYVVIQEDRTPPHLIEFVKDAWRLEEIGRDGSTVLYVPTIATASS
jgi:hypothetical protein